MTDRRKQIEESAYRWARQAHAWANNDEDCVLLMDLAEGYEKGAEWADANPASAVSNAEIPPQSSIPVLRNLLDEVERLLDRDDIPKLPYLEGAAARAAAYLAETPHPNPEGSEARGT